MIVVTRKSYVLSFGRITYRKKKRKKRKRKSKKKEEKERGKKMSDLRWRQGDASSRRNIKKASFWSSKCLLKVFRSRSLECESIHGHWRSPSKRTTKKGKIHRKEIFLWSVLGEEMERLIEGLVVLSLKKKKREKKKWKKKILWIFHKFSIPKYIHENITHTIHRFSKFQQLIIDYVRL